MTRYVTLPGGLRMGLGAYAKAWKALLALPPATRLAHSRTGWDTAGEALAALRAGLDDRINRHLPAYGRGRKWDPDWFWPMARAARELNTPRLLIRWLPADMMKVARFRERVEYARSI